MYTIKTTTKVTLSFLSVTLLALLTLGCERDQVVAEISLEAKGAEATDENDNTYPDDTDSAYPTDTSDPLEVSNDNLENGNGYFDSDYDDNNREDEDDDDQAPPTWEDLCGSVERDRSIVISSQKAWDSLQQEHFTWIQGDVVISNPDDGDFNITSLSKFRDLQCIEGNLEILHLPQLVDLDDLFGLWHIGGNLHIAQNPVLESIDGLMGVVDLGNRAWDPEFNIVDNDLLSTCDAHQLLWAVSGNDHVFDGEVCISENQEAPNCDDTPCPHY